MRIAGLVEAELLWLKKYLHLFIFRKRLIISLDKTLGWDHAKPFEVAQKLQFGPSTRWPPLKSTVWKNPGIFSSKTFITF